MSGGHIVDNYYEPTSREEARSLLGRSSTDDAANDDILIHPGPSQAHLEPQSTPKPPHSPPTHVENLRPLRNTNRVRFDLDDDSEDEHDGRPRIPENYTGDHGIRGQRSNSGQLAPLLTGIEAPSATIAISESLSPLNLEESVLATSGIRSAFMNMANSIMGAGIIGQPYAFRQAGLLTGVLLLIGLTVTVDWTIRLIVVNSKMSGADSFQTTVQFCFGRPGLIAISVAQWAFAFGGMIAFCIIIGDTIPHVFAAAFPSIKDMSILWLLTERRAVIILFVLGVSYPLSLYRDISKLAKSSALALMSMLVIVTTVVSQAFRIPSDLRGDFKGFWIVSNGFLQAVGVISFAFVCRMSWSLISENSFILNAEPIDHNSLLIYGSLKKPTLDRFALVTHYSTGVSMIMCLAMGLGGFLTFGSKTDGNVLNNFPSENVMANIARFCFGLNMLATLPLEAFVCRSVMTNFYFPEEPFNPHRHLIFTSSVVMSSVILALFTCDLGAVFELIGATSACALAYILPPLCYIKLSRKSWLTKFPAFCCVLFGTIVMILSVILALIKMNDAEGSARMC